jgi:hypothetical protein
MRPTAEEMKRSVEDAKSVPASIRLPLLGISDGIVVGTGGNCEIRTGSPLRLLAETRAHPL